MQLPSPVSAVVFDCDGLLLDTESCWSRAEAALFANYGYGFGPAEKDLLIGRTLKAACDSIADYIGQPGAGPRLQSELLPRVEAELAATVEAMPGAPELLECLAGRVAARCRHQQHPCHAQRGPGLLGSSRLLRGIRGRR